MDLSFRICGLPVQLRFLEIRFVEMKTIYLGIGTIILSTVAITGCGTVGELEVSPEEKRNNFDACVIDYLAENYYPGSWDTYRPNAEKRCVFHLR